MTKTQHKSTGTATVRPNRSVVTYLRRKKLLPETETPTPVFRTGAPHPHAEPVTPAPRLTPPQSPTEVATTA